MTLQEALLEARKRWGAQVTVCEEQRLGEENTRFVYVKLRGNSGHQATGHTWEEAFADADEGMEVVR